MYVGRIVSVGRTKTGQIALGYRVSSRSFPNRVAQQFGSSFHIVPKAGTPDAVSDSPYIAYECLVWDEKHVVVSNGTHTRPIFERLRVSGSVRDAIISVLVGLDREFDAHDTPRICGVVDIAEDRLWLGSITADAISVRPVDVAAGQCRYISTYEFPLVDAEQIDPEFNVESASSISTHMMGGSVFGRFNRPVCAVGAVVTPAGVEAHTMGPV